MPEADDSEQLSEQERQWKDWLQHPATQRLRQWAASEMEFLKEQWAAGTYTDMSQFGTAILNAKAIGGCEVYYKITQLEYSLIGDSTND